MLYIYKYVNTARDTIWLPYMIAGNEIIAYHNEYLLLIGNN